MFRVEIVTMAGHILEIKNSYQTFEHADKWARDVLGFLGVKARFVHVYREDRNNQSTLPGPYPYGDAPEYAPVTSD